MEGLKFLEALRSIPEVIRARDNNIEHNIHCMGVMAIDDVRLWCDHIVFYEGSLWTATADGEFVNHTQGRRDHQTDMSECRDLTITITLMGIEPDETGACDKSFDYLLRADYSLEAVVDSSIYMYTMEPSFTRKLEE